MSDLATATEAATLAVQYDKIQDTEKAVECYRTAARCLDEYLDKRYMEIPPDVRYQYTSKVEQYLKRAADLEDKNDNKRLVHQCDYLFRLALDADQADKLDEALELYMRAVQLTMDVDNVNSKMKTDLVKIARKALERAEQIKGIERKPSPTHSVKVPVTPKAPLQRETSVHLQLSTGNDSYTQKEKEVLLYTSKINNNSFLPFMSVDLHEKFQYLMPFEDADGRLKLAAKQIRAFERWARPDELSSEPKLIAGSHVDCYSVKQTIVSDCSFIASLTVSAQYEKRFNKKLITSIIYPQNKNGVPIYNPFGKYMVKLQINGIRRKVIIDDYLPLGKYGQLLCSYSSNKNEFWVSLLEKAYMKVMGGYDFPGSNSNTDLHALTGWIPERTSIRRGEADFNSDDIFEKIRLNLERGNLLATVATGPLPPAEEERTGLAATHAYSVLDVRLVNGIKLLKLKNPWSHTKWKGNYSDSSSMWSEDLRRELDYNTDSTSRFENEDNGVFWIDYNSILNFFDVFYMNWNPDLFKMTYCIHERWDAEVGPQKDNYNVGENPQFSLEVRAGCKLWLLLTRHITNIDDFRDNQEYITLLVYKTNGRRVYYPQDPPPYIDGVRINSPHYLCQIPPSDSTVRYTLVVSQYEKTTTTYYTLRAYGTTEFMLRKLEGFPVTRKIQGEWDEHTAGGCENHPQSFLRNPKFLMTVPDGRKPCSVVVQLRGPRKYQMGIKVGVHSLDDPNVTAPFVKRDSGSYRSGFVVLDLPSLPAGKYIVTVATFNPGEEGAFILDFNSTGNISVAKMSS